MNKFNQRHEAIIKCYYAPTKDAKEGEVIPHTTRVSGVYFYKRHFIDEQEVFLKIELTKEMLLDLAADIIETEGKIVELPFESIPF